MVYLLFGILFVLIFVSMLLNISIVYPLFLGLLLFSIYALKLGYSVKEVFKMILNGGKKSIVVIKIFILIGAIMAIWLSSGTVPYIVYIGIKFMNPKFFLVYAFLICSFVSYLIGSAFGTAGTIGIALIILAKGSGINLNLAAGAILSGSFFGDRCSPMSSSANLVSTLTETELYENIKNMIKTSIIPTILTVIIYFLLSINQKISIENNSLLLELKKEFVLNPSLLVPALLIILLSLFKVDVKKSITVSIVSAIILAILIQNRNIIDILRDMIFGFEIKNDSLVAKIIKGGGILSMAKVSAIVFISSAYSGIFEATGMLKKLENNIHNMSKIFGTTTTTLLVSIFTSLIGFTQALSVILAVQFVKAIYNDKKYKLALDIENSAILLAPLVPWNIAGAVPATILGVGHEFLVYAVYLYLLPIFYLISNKKSVDWVKMAH